MWPSKFCPNLKENNNKIDLYVFLSYIPQICNLLIFQGMGKHLSFQVFFIFQASSHCDLTVGI